MLEHCILGLIQGIAEWIPVSAKTCVIGAKTHFFHSNASLNELIKYALFLQLGTFLAGACYFRKDLMNVFASVMKPIPANVEGRKLLLFLTLTTILTIAGQFIIGSVHPLAYSLPRVKIFVTSIFAAVMIIGGMSRLRKPCAEQRCLSDLAPLDGILLGAVQAFAALPGLNRAGTTMAGLFFRNFENEQVLKLSFLMSLPVVFLTNIVKNYQLFLVWGPQWSGVAASFLTGVVTIGILMKFARSVGTGVFFIVIGSLLAIATMAGLV